MQTRDGSAVTAVSGDSYWARGLANIGYTIRCEMSSFLRENWLPQERSVSPT